MNFLKYISKAIIKVVEFMFRDACKSGKRKAISSLQFPYNKKHGGRQLMNRFEAP
jgi:hypothetical protein